MPTDDGKTNRLDFSGTTNREWERPALSGEDHGFGVDRPWDDLSRAEQDEVEDNFLITKGRQSPPDDFGDLAVPVVDPMGDLDPSNDKLSERGVANADGRVHQVGGVSADVTERANTRINSLQDGFFGGAGER